MANGMLIKVDSDVNGAVSGINQLNKSLAGLPRGSSQATTALTNFSRVVQDAPFGIIGIANNIDPLIQSFQQLKKETGSSQLAFKALLGTLTGGGGLALAVSTISSLLVYFTMNTQKAKESTKEVKTETQQYAESLDKISNTISSEVVKVGSLVNALQTLSLTRGQQKNIIAELTKLAPGYFDNLKTEKNLIDNLSTAYFLYRNSITQAFRAKLAEEEFKKVSDALLDIERQIQKFEGKNRLDLGKLLGKAPTNDKGRTFLVDENNRLINIAALYAERQRLQTAFLGLQNTLNASQNSYVQGIITEGQVREKNLKEFKAASDGLVAGYLANNVALAEQAKLQLLLNDLQRKSNTLRGSGGLTNGLSDPNDPSLKSTIKIFDPSVLDSLQQVNKKALDLKDTINNGINGGIDTFFNSIANNQDPFKALAQSAQRLVVELGAAVVKMLVLKAIANVIAPGAGGFAVDAASRLGGSGLFGGLLRGQNISLSLLRGAQGG